MFSMISMQYLCSRCLAGSLLGATKVSIFASRSMHLLNCLSTRIMLHQICSEFRDDIFT